MSFRDANRYPENSAKLDKLTSVKQRLPGVNWISAYAGMTKKGNKKTPLYIEFNTHYAIIIIAKRQFNKREGLK